MGASYNRFAQGPKADLKRETAHQGAPLLSWDWEGGISPRRPLRHLRQMRLPHPLRLQLRHPLRPRHLH